MAAEWDRRQLCPDGACVGVIGPDGTCKACGRVAPNWGDERNRGLQELDDEDADDEDAEERPASAGSSGPAAATTPEWRDRKLCPDGGCIGVIGANGTCSVCGKAAGAPVNAEDEEDAEADELAGHEEDDEDYEDEEDDGDEDEDEDEDEDDADEDEADDEALSAAAEELAGIATPPELASADQLATSAGGARSAVDDDDRRLCPDGGCVGLIGPDGTCKICGKAAA